jgi:hypothetical protein
VLQPQPATIALKTGDVVMTREQGEKKNCSQKVSGSSDHGAATKAVM